MENPELTALTILFMREHNYLVGRLRLSNPNWTGDQLYNMAKEINIAEYQNIVYNEYLPVLIGNVLGAYRGYDPNVQAQAAQEFSTAAFRVGHSQVSDTQTGVDNSGKIVFTESLAQAFFNTPEIDISNGINPLLHSLSGDFSQATDVYTVGALRNLLFAPLAGGNTDKIDLIAIDIQRERDVGIGSLNQVRASVGLPRYNSWSDLTSDKVLQNNLQTVYGNINNIDLFMGGLAEAHVPGAVVGKTFQTIIAKQFQALRSGDRFFWLNEGFDDRSKSIIGATTLATILKRNTDIVDSDPLVFVTTTPRSPRPRTAMPTLVRLQGRNRPFLNDGT
jgi:peroxidase